MRKRQAGFTLVEAMVVGILSTMVAGVSVFLLQMSADQVDDGMANITLSGRYTALREDIEKHGRRAQVVKIGGDASGSPPLTVLPDSITPGFAGRSEIVFCNRLGDSIAGYRIQDDTLRELTGPSHGRVWSPMRLGQDVVLVDGARSHFDVLANRRGVNFYLRLVSAEDDTLPAVEETVLCRNAYRF